MMTQKLATFKIDEERWEAFKAAADSQHISASELLKRFVDWIIAGNQLPEVSSAVEGIEQLIDARVVTILEAQLESRLETFLQGRLGEQVA